MLIIFYLLGIDVYFDEYDPALRIAVQTRDPKGVVTAIKKGIENSTHMLVVISPATKDSQWVPFEVGYGYERTELASLTLKGIKKSDLPDYLKVAPIIRNIDDLNELIRRFRDVTHIDHTKIIKGYMPNHPLQNVMDKLIIS